MGNREGLSFSDIRLVNEMYQCAANNNCQQKQCPTGAFQGQDCKCYCDSGDRSDPTMECDGSAVRPTPRPEETTTTRPMMCEDEHEYCPQWAGAGYCTGRYETYMSKTCKYSCNKCNGKFN